MENDRFVLRSITDEIMYELMLLSGQEYVDVYATSIKKNVLQTAVDRARQIGSGQAGGLGRAECRRRSRRRALPNAAGATTATAAAPAW